ncbi:dipeptide/oligopeptide/nickel ABC transporter ATP-binding protein [Pseudonocardia sp. CNS-004]|nr:dipeptide/oligopeptide/nickel ABC transporter ATP-binding protein [Pseudonocardia sp. CNS-004]
MTSGERAPSDTAPLLVAEGLTKTFTLGRGRGKNRVLTAVDGVGFELRRGETLGIVGESGSGKSTLARLVLRLIEPTSGSVRYDGTDLLALSERDMRQMRRDIQMIFQDPYASLHPRRTVTEIVSEPWNVHRGMVERHRFHDRVVELLDQVGLPSRYAGLYPSQMSGGQRQRVAIARALALKPTVLVLDEPVSALDVSVQAQVITLLMQLQEELGLAYVFISHDLPLVHLVADRVAVMYRGKFVETGTSDEVYANPQHEYTRKLLSVSALAADPATTGVLAPVAPSPGPSG